MHSSFLASSPRLLEEQPLVEQGSLSSLKNAFLPSLGRGLPATAPTLTGSAIRELSYTKGRILSELEAVRKGEKAFDQSLLGQLEAKLDSKLKQYKVPESLDQELDAINQKAETWTANYTPVFLMPYFEWVGLMGLEPPSEQDRRKSEEILRQRQGAGSPLTRLNEPANFDWRNLHGQNYVTPVRDQSDCGSCWAFGALASLEASANAYYNNPKLGLDLSEQDLVSCFHGSGCSGASASQIESLFSQYLTKTGVAAESCFPYQSENAICSIKCQGWEERGWAAESYADIDLSIDAIKAALMQYGPVEAGMRVYSDLKAYSGGIYIPQGTDTGYAHAVTIVGFGSYDGIDYWIVKNSWGPDWGEDGFFRIKMGECMIDSWFAFAPVKPFPLSGNYPKKLCHDWDRDGYCSWGLGEKPSGENPLWESACPICRESIEDCDDSDSSIYQGCFASQNAGILKVNGQPAGSAVYVKDLGSGELVFRGIVPLELVLDAGVREITVAKPGYVAETSETAVSEDQVATLNFALEADPDVQEGWFNQGLGSYDSPVALDLDREDSLGVVAGSHSSHSFYVFDSDGSTRAGWPAELFYGVVEHSIGTPALSDFDNDARLEIVEITSPILVDSTIYLHNLVTGEEQAVTAISDNAQHPFIGSGKVVWEGKQDAGIHLLNLATGEKARATDNPNDTFPTVFGKTLVWNRQGSIMLCDLNNATGSALDWCSRFSRMLSPLWQEARGKPMIEGNLVVWAGRDKSGLDFDIFLFDLSKNSLSQITDSSVYQAHPFVFGNKIVWDDGDTYGTTEICFCDLDGSTGSLSRWCSTPVQRGGGLRRLTSDTDFQGYPSIHSNRVVWQEISFSESGSIEGYGIFLYDLQEDKAEKIQASDMLLSEASVHGNRIAWVGKGQGLWDYSVYACDLSGAGSNLSHWCSTQVSEGGGLKKITQGKVFEVSPVLSDGKLVCSGIKDWWLTPVSVFRDDASLLRPEILLGSSDFYFRSSPTLSNLDSDPEPEIVFGTIYLDMFAPVGAPISTGKMHAFNIDGSPVQGWPQEPSYGYSFRTSAAIGNIDNTAGVEIVAASLARSAEQEGLVYAWHADGTAVEGWPAGIGSYGSLMSEPALADLDSEPGLEIVVGSESGSLYAWHNDATPLPGFPLNLGSQLNSPSIGDLDSDGLPEIVVTSFGGNVFVVDASGNVVNEMQAPGGFDAPAAIGDLSGDSVPEIIVASLNGELHAWHGNGLPVEGFPKWLGGSVYSSVSLTDLDLDKDLEIVVTTEDGSLFPGTYVFDLKVPFDNNSMDWPMFGHDFSNTSCYKCPQAGQAEERPFNMAWDIDGNGSLDSETDGKLVASYLLGFSGNHLTEGKIGENAARATPEEVGDYLNFFLDQGYLDVDGDSAHDAMTDGVLVCRYMRGISGQALIESAIAPNATRTSAWEITLFLESARPPSEGGLVFSCSVLKGEGKTYLLGADIHGKGSSPCIEISAPSITIDCAGHSILLEGDAAGIYSSHENTTIKNCVVSAGTQGGTGYNSKGIFLENAHNSLVLDNILNGMFDASSSYPLSLGQWFGLHLLNSDNCEVRGNTASSNAMHGIWLENSSGNVLYGNNSGFNGYTGIYLSDSSSENSLSLNVAFGNNFDGIGALDSGGNSLNQNTSCENNASGNGNYRDFKCGSSSLGFGGGGNIFGSVEACADSWPGSADYSSCAAEVKNVAENYGKKDCGYCGGADLDSDNDVDVHDLQMLLASGSGSLPLGNGEFAISSLGLDPTNVSAPGSFNALVMVQNSSGEEALAVVAVSVFSSDGSEAALVSDSGAVSAGSKRSFSIPVSVPVFWANGNYEVRVVVSSQGVEQARSSKFLSVAGGGATAPIFSVPELSILFLPLLLALVLLLVFRKGKPKYLK